MKKFLIETVRDVGIGAVLGCVMMAGIFGGFVITGVPSERYGELLAKYLPVGLIVAALFVGAAKKRLRAIAERRSARKGLQYVSLQSGKDEA